MAARPEKCQLRPQINIETKKGFRGGESGGKKEHLLVPGGLEVVLII